MGIKMYTLQTDKPQENEKDFSQKQISKFSYICFGTMGINHNLIASKRIAIPGKKMRNMNSRKELNSFLHT